MLAYEFTTGSAISPGSWIPLMLLALTCDWRLACVTGWVTGILAIFLIPAWAPVHWAQIFVEHLVAFSALGYAGIFGNGKKWKGETRLAGLYPQAACGG